MSRFAIPAMALLLAACGRSHVTDPARDGGEVRDADSSDELELPIEGVCLQHQGESSVRAYVRYDPEVRPTRCEATTLEGGVLSLRVVGERVEPPSDLGVLLPPTGCSHDFGSLLEPRRSLDCPVSEGDPGSEQRIDVGGIERRLDWPEEEGARRCVAWAERTDETPARGTVAETMCITGAICSGQTWLWGCAGNECRTERTDFVDDSGAGSDVEVALVGECVEPDRRIICWGAGFGTGQTASLVSEHGDLVARAEYTRMRCVE